MNIFLEKIKAIRFILTISIIFYGSSYALEFNYIPEKAIVGEDKSLGVFFSSSKGEDELPYVLIEVNQKLFSAKYSANGEIYLNGTKKGGDPAFLEEKDIAVLISLDSKLKNEVKQSSPFYDQLRHFIVYLTFYHPPNSTLDNNVEKKKVEPLCKYLTSNEYVQGEYIIEYPDYGEYKCYEGAEMKLLSKGVRCIEQVRIGPPFDCMGRCGPGCEDWWPDDGYTQDCLNHDLCTRAIGTTDTFDLWGLKKPCLDEAIAAREDFFGDQKCTCTLIIDYPNNDTTWVKGKNAKIEWVFRGMGCPETVGIKLRRASDPAWWGHSIDCTKNDGKCQFKVPEDIEAAQDYYVRITFKNVWQYERIDSEIFWIIDK